MSVGVALGLAAFGALGGLGAVGFAGVPLREGALLSRPALEQVLMTLVVLLGAGLVALVGAGGLPWLRTARWGAGGIGSALVVGWLVACYDNGWSTGPWPDYARTMSLVATVAIAAFAWCVLAAGWVLAGPGRVAARTWWCATVTLTLSLGWLCYATLPFVLSWGPVLLGLVACVVVAALSGRRDKGSALGW